MIEEQKLPINLWLQSILEAFNIFIFSKSYSTLCQLSYLLIAEYVIMVSINAYCYPFGSKILYLRIIVQYLKITERTF